MKNIKLTIAFAAAVLTLAGCNLFSSKKADSAAQQTVSDPLVSVTTVHRQSVEQKKVYTSTVQANVINNIAPQSVGRILQINTEVGEFVTKGQVLAVMDANTLIQAKLKMKNDSTELTRLKALHEAGALSQSDYDNVKLAYEVSKRNYDNLLENTVLKSPIDGVITARNYDKGDMYSMSMPLFTVQQIVPVKLYIGVSESEYTKVKPGQKVTLTVEAFPGTTFDGEVIRLYPIIDASTHTFKVEIRVANRYKTLRPGMFAKVTLTFGTNNSIVVPDNAIVKQAGTGDRFVYVYNPADSTVDFRKVVLGVQKGTEVEILEGLSDGEQVVTAGQIRLKDEIKVRLNEE
ncbi:MAG: efflux RND transporter periplasmic adaptor subunit [Bacteroidales bacterium]|nr:efflux RND transporter periplasmic adaptor subunit [Bacteroidales bacterium]